ncbi:hypothetical protein FVEG_15400 [Fusarium verticillioides 7600]|uniref:Uncharacterized protein n=1 Tax=Gibberella moniliformis (strain M3125 / FGSC 7600) TaxID=334819 RepID=W7MBE6_GIBM7|nr:hypothetical protein FVEG_15400 [Fusarium verticillioides 7600]EWG42182.1 hypothetical protein FVEG_15400 [Fusarium verticillioides 7600]
MSAVPSPTVNGSSAQHQPLRSALKNEDDVDRPCPSSGSLKAVQIAEPESEIQTLEDDSQPTKQFPTNLRRRLSGKPLPSPLPTTPLGLPSATVLLAAGLKRHLLLRTPLRATTMAMATAVNIIVRNYSPRSEIG